MNIRTARLPIRPRLLLLLVAIMLTMTTGSTALFANADNGVLKGTVQETVNAAGYTYINLASPEGTKWIAIPETTITKGQEMSFASGMEMKDFHSKTLNRTFPSIIFSEGIVSSPHGSNDAPAKPAAADSFASAVQAEKQTAAPQAKAAQGSGGSMGAIAPFSEINVEKADGDNAYSVGELFEKAEELDGKTIRIRGKVVKFNANIMGRNWLHLQDGTGDPMQNSHDLVITTKEEIGSPGIITAEGTLAANKDFGAGYKYEIIIEDAAILK